MQFKMKRWNCPKCNQVYYGCKRCYDCDWTVEVINKEQGVRKIQNLNDLILPDYRRRGNFVRLKSMKA